MLEVYSNRRKVWGIRKDIVCFDRKKRKVGMRMKDNEGGKKSYMKN